MLRKVMEDDLPIFFEHQREPDANRMAAFPARERDAFMTHWRSKVLAEPANEARTIVADGEIAGNIVSWEQDGQRTIGYWLGKRYWGKGIATAALAEFLATHEKRRPLHADVASANLGSMRVLEKCGFQRISGPSLASDGVEVHAFRLGK
jgi:RimJ/RimL family protein N-acetyltransferase